MMTDYHGLEQALLTTLTLSRRPVAVAFRDAPPAGVEKFAGVEPSGCSLECNDPRLLQQWVARWQDLIEFEFVPVVPSKETAEAIAPLP